jgi:hypothetical protein
MIWAFDKIRVRSRTCFVSCRVGSCRESFRVGPRLPGRSSVPRVSGNFPCHACRARARLRRPRTRHGRHGRFPDTNDMTQENARADAIQHERKTSSDGTRADATRDATSFAVKQSRQQRSWMSSPGSSWTPAKSQMALNAILRLAASLWWRVPYRLLQYPWCLWKMVDPAVPQELREPLVDDLFDGCSYSHQASPMSSCGFGSRRFLDFARFMSPIGIR